MSTGGRPLIGVRGAVVEHRTRRGGVTRALDGVDFELHAGDFVALLGPNGSGKSTLLRVLAGLRSLGRGEVVRRDVRLGVVFQSPALDPLLTVRENLRLQAALFGIGQASERIERLCAEQGIDDRLGHRVKTLSGGLARRVEFVRAVLAEPDVLLLDEATVGLDLPSRAALLGAIDVLRAQRPELAVVMSTHLMTDAERCAAVVMLSGGRVAGRGTPRELVGELGGLLLRVPGGVAVDGMGVSWETQADGSRVARPEGASELAAWSRALAAAGVPFSVRQPTLADAYLHWARAPLDEPAGVGS